MKNRSRIICLGSATSLIVFAYLLCSTGMPEHPPSISRHILALIAAVLGIAIATFGSTRITVQSDPRIPVMPKNAVVGILILILGYGATVRLTGLESNPPPLWYDEANHGLDAIMLLETDYHPLLFPSNCGQEPIYKYMTAGAVALFGPRPLAVRIGAAVTGSLTLLFFYLWIRTVCNGVWALCSTLLLASSFWHVHFSKIGFRSILVPLFLAVVFYCYETADRRVSSWGYATAGLLLGAGVYGYIAYRLVPVLFIIFVAFTFRSKTDRHTSKWPGTLWMIPGFLIAVLPLAIIGLSHPEQLISRVSLTSVFSAAGNPIWNIFHNLHQHILFPITGGDPILRHGLPGRPPLSAAGAVLFGLGLGSAISNSRQAWARAGLIFYLGLILPGILSVPVQAPATLRCLGAVIPVFMLCGAGFMNLTSGYSRRFMILSALFLMTAAIAQNAYRHHYLWPNAIKEAPIRDRSEFGFNQDEVAIANYINRRSDPLETVYLSPQLRLHPTIRFLTWNKSTYEGIYRPEYFKYVTKNNRSLAVVLHLKDRNIWWLRNSDQKQFFWFWKHVEQLTDGELQAMINYCYPGKTYLMNDADTYILEQIKEIFPTGNVKPFGNFTVFSIYIDGGDTGEI
jgi:Dolichyl-phosphate-mannose-protein mannosyltransferase